MKKALIVASGNINMDVKSIGLIMREIHGSDIVISADGGARHLAPLFLNPNYIVGDFDSISSIADVVRMYPDADVIEFPVKKDKTDSELAIDIAIDERADEIVLLGVTGTRFDHSISNVFMLKKAFDRGIAARIVDGNNVIYYAEDSSVNVSGEIGDYVSIIPISDRVEGVETTGLEYTVREGLIEFGSTYGVSNVLSEERASIRIGRGKALIIRSFD